MARRPPVQAVPGADLQLKAYWVEELKYIDSTATGTMDSSGEAEVRVSKPKFFESDGAPQSHLIRLRVEVIDGDRSVDVTIVGVFAAAEDLSSERLDAIQSLLHINGPSILFGLARGVIAAATAYGSRGRLDVPSVNLVSVLF